MPPPFPAHPAVRSAAAMAAATARAGARAFVMVLMIRSVSVGGIAAASSAARDGAAVCTWHVASIDCPAEIAPWCYRDGTGGPGAIGPPGQAGAPGGRPSAPAR